MEKDITIWYRYDHKLQRFTLNHVQDGLTTKDVPDPKTPEHNKLWAGGQWKSVAAKINEQGVIVWKSEQM